jgi:hypothetical protein
LKLRHCSLVSEDGESGFAKEEIRKPRGNGRMKNPIQIMLEFIFENGLAMGEFIYGS